MRSTPRPVQFSMEEKQRAKNAHLAHLGAADPAGLGWLLGGGAPTTVPPKLPGGEASAPPVDKASLPAAADVDAAGESGAAADRGDKSDKARLARMKKILGLAEQKLQHAHDELTARDRRIQELEAAALGNHE